MGASCGDEDALVQVLLKMPGLNAILSLQLLQVLAVQEECLRCSEDGCYSPNIALLPVLTVLSVGLWMQGHCVMRLTTHNHRCCEDIELLDDTSAYCP